MPKPTWFKAERRESDNTADISIYSEIGGFGVSTQMFADDLKALGNPEEIRLSISSDGGDVSVGFSIFNMLRRHNARKIVTVEGLAASMASVIAMAGDEVVMPSNAQMMIHNPWGMAYGESEQIISFGQALGQMKDSIVAAYRDRTGLSKAKLVAMMDRETWLTAKESVDMGFADRIEKAVAMASLRVDLSKFNKVPASFGRMIKESKMSKKPNAEVENDEDGGTVAKTEAEIRAEVLAQNKSVRSLCAIAGKAELADKFIEENKTQDEVIAALDALRVEEAAKGKGKKSTEVNGRSQGASGGTTDGSGVAVIDHVDIYAKWNSAGRAA